LATTISIGIRVSPSVVYYSILKELDEQIEFLVVDKLILPAALSLPEQLKFIRNTFLDILREFDVTVACIRVTESNAQSAHFGRIGIEAVIQELFASSSIEHYFVGVISSISAKLGFNRDQFKGYVTGTTNYENIEEWPDFKPESREALLAAFSALKLI